MPRSFTRAAWAGTAKSMRAARAVARCLSMLIVLEGAESGKETLKPALAAGDGDLALAGVADAGVGDAGRGHAIDGTDVCGADQTGDLDKFVAAVDVDKLLALHQHRAVGVDLGNRHADFDVQAVGLRGFAFAVERQVAADRKSVV